MVRHSESRGRGESRGRTWGGGVWTAFLAVVGGTLLFAGAVLALAQRISPEASWVATSLAKIGIGSGELLAAGIVTLGLAILQGGQARVSRRTAFLENAATELSELRKGQKRLADRFGTLHLELSVLQESNKTLLRAAQDQTAVHAAGQQVDATFRLAASMDQLGARLEGMLQDQRSDLESRLGDLSGSILETREHVATWLSKQLDETDEEWLEGELEELEDSELEEALEKESEVFLEGFSADEESEWDPQTPAELPGFDDLEELEVLVTLEDEETEGEEEELYPLFDQLLEEATEAEIEANRTDATEEAAAKEDEEEIPPEEMNLGLLDELDENGTWIAEAETGRAPIEEPPPPWRRRTPTGPEADAGEGDAATPRPPSVIRSDLTDEVLKEALNTVKRRRGI